MSEEETINKIKEVIKYDEEHRIPTKFDEKPLFREYLQNILDLYQKEKEKNKVIEIYRKDMPKDTKLIIMRKEDFDRNYSSEYIHKDKIKEKIKEYKKEADYKTIDNPTGRIHFHKEPCDYQIEILQELLEERN